MTTLPACALSGLLIFVALVIGPATLVWLFIRIVRKASDVECEREKKDVGVPPWITGTFERLAFGYVGVEEAGAILAGWIAAKLSGRYMGRRGSCGEHTKKK